MVNVIPKPNQLVNGKGSFIFNHGMTIDKPFQSGAATLLENKLLKSAGIHLKDVSTGEKAVITLRIDKSIIQSLEGYKLIIKSNQITINAATENGLYYGVQTLLQLLPFQIESDKKVNAKWEVPCVTITDAPKFTYRGVMLDVARHFITVDHLKKLIDVFAMIKINKLHLHLTDDQGWRIEIKRYPKLTKIGSSRIEADGTIYSGFYTQDQIREIVNYAASRYIEIIPEIEMPGHALAAIAAYPQYSCNANQVAVRSTWGIEKNLFCAGNDSTYIFLSNIISEVISLFPSSYIHIGGDECPKDKWRECSKCQNLMKLKGFKDEEELQCYFVNKISQILKKGEKQIIGWDDIYGGDYPKDATIMSWRGEIRGIDAANAGQDVIMTPTSTQYLDFYQGSPYCEPVKIGELTTLQQVYSYNPVSTRINPLMANHIKGVQGNLWSEYLYKPELFEYQLFPRMFAVAEVGWTKPENKDVDEFIKRIDNLQLRLDEHGLIYYIPMPEGNLNYIWFADSLRLPFTANRPVNIVFTDDGSTPTNSSSIYCDPILITKTTTLKLRSVLTYGKMSDVRTIELIKTSPLIAINGINDKLKNGLRMQYTKNEKYKDISELQIDSNWNDTIVNNTNDFFKISSPDETHGAAVFTGYMKIDKDDNYAFHCGSDQLFLDDKLVINNNRLIKKNASTDIVIPMNAGYHSVKVILINRTSGGVPSNLLDSQILYQPYVPDSKELKWIPISYFY
jgi:hexosaminidase